jgi:CDGSH-type Zn-finger protein
MSIQDISSLRQHLQWAIELEHATLTPYMCALYSIKDGHNQEAVEILRSIFMEEMLHMTLAANVLNAVGGNPVLDTPDFIPEYPSYLPHSNKKFKVPLGIFSPETIATLMKIERPEAADAPPEDEQYETIGQFYKAIIEGLKTLSEQLGEQVLFSGDPDRQIETDSTVYGGSGQIIPVTDLDSALSALSEIMHQGEGMDFENIWDGDRNMFHHESEEVGHYFRLNEILEGRRYQTGDTPQSGPTGKTFEVDWNAVQQPSVARTDAGQEKVINEKTEIFCRRYREILQLLEKGFNGDKSAFARSVGSMYKLKQDVIELLELTSKIDLKYVANDAPNAPLCLKILPGGPYAIQGSIPLVKKSIVRSEGGEPLAWSQEEPLEVSSDYALCRCGASSNKPFCDGSHATIEFDGNETTDMKIYSECQKEYPGKGILMKDVRSLCFHAGFCRTRVTDAWSLTRKSDDIQARIELIAMIEHCPSGALTYALDDARKHHETGEPAWQSIEPALPRSIALMPNGPLWVTGGIPIIRSDNTPMEVRNRVALCRCGHSKNKPYCDGTHAEVGFKG